MVDLKLVSMVEEQSTVGAASALLFDQGGQSRTDRRVLPSSFTPIHPISIVRTPIACDFRVSQTGGVGMGGEVCLTRTGGGRGKHLAGFPSVPVPVATQEHNGVCAQTSPRLSFFRINATG